MLGFVGSIDGLLDRAEAIDPAHGTITARVPKQAYQSIIMDRRLITNNKSIPTLPAPHSLPPHRC